MPITFQKSAATKTHFGFKCVSLLLLLRCTGPKETPPVPAIESAPVPIQQNVSGKGKISGTVTFTGELPPPKKLSMNADPLCARLYQGKEPPLVSDIEIGPAKGLANAFVYIKEGAPSAPVPFTSVTLDQRGCQYHPHILGLQVGQPLRILNSDPTLHNVNALAKNNTPFNIGMSTVGQNIEKKFTKPEVMIRFKCDVHGWMNAYVGILDHAFFTVTDSSGKFEFSNLGPGDYTIEAWHEKLGNKQTQAKIAITQGQTNISLQW